MCQEQTKKKVRFALANTLTQDRARRIKKKKKKENYAQRKLVKD